MTLGVFENEAKAIEFQERLNEMHSKLKYIVKTERDYILPFLDMPVKFTNKIFKTDLIRRKYLYRYVCFLQLVLYFIK